MNKPLASLAGLAAALMATPALAHPGHDQGTGFAAGFWHPLTGADHLAAMLLVGLWAGFLAPRRMWLIPMAFLGAMVAGFAIGNPALGNLVLGAAAEPLILLSLLGVGGALALRRRAPMVLAVAAAALFGFAHGHAHGVEAPEGAMPLWFAAGFLLASGGLQALGLWLARILPVPLVRAIGASGMGLGLLLAGTS